MPHPGGERRIAVRFDERVWGEATRGFSGRAIEIANSARCLLDHDGVALTSLRPCEGLAPDRTELAGCAKLYLPVDEGLPPSERPFAFVLQLARDTEGSVVFVFVAFGPRHPGPGVRSVYERAHRQLHGRFP